MEIKFLDFVRFIENSTCLDELRIKCNLMYGVDFESILDNFLKIFRKNISYEFIKNVDLKFLSDYLTYIAKDFEERHKIYIQKSVNYEINFIRHIDEYSLPECGKIENISINI